MATLPSSNSVTSETTGSITSDSGTTSTTGTTKPTAISADDARSSSNKVATLPSSDSGTTGITKPTARSSSNKVATLPSSETSITTSRSSRSLGAGEDHGSGKGGKKRPGGQTGLSQDAGACDCVEMWTSGCVEELPGTFDVVEEDSPSKGTSMTSSDSGISKKASLIPSASGDTAIEAKAEKNGGAKDDDKKPVLDVARGEGGTLSSKGGSKAGSKTGRSIGSSSEKTSKGSGGKSRKAGETSRSSTKSSKGSGRKLLPAEAEVGKTPKKAKGGAYDCFDFCGCDPPTDDQLRNPL